MYRKMLVPVDGSELAEVAFPYAKELAGRLDTDIVFLHVCGTPETECVSVYRAYVEHAAEKVIEESREVQKRTAGLPMPRPVQAQGVVVVGHPAEGILNYAEQNDIDLILMATHGHSGVRHWAMGSVADKVVSISKIPVWLVPAGTPRMILYDQWPKATLLVTLDGSKLAELVLPHVETIARQRGADFTEIVLFQVCQPPVILADYPEAVMPAKWEEHVDEALAWARQDAEKYLSGVGERLKNKGLRARSEVATGSPAEEILDYTRRSPFSLIVMSTHGRSGLSRWAYGSVAHKVLYGASSPILLVRAH